MVSPSFRWHLLLLPIIILVNEGNAWTQGDPISASMLVTKPNNSAPRYRASSVRMPSSTSRQLSLPRLENARSGDQEVPPQRIRRLSIAGVSVSPQGFWLMLQVPEAGVWPLQLTTSKDDAFRATTPEALTILQLIAGVDMAGAILPPDTLSKLAVLECEVDPTIEVAEQIAARVKENLPVDCKTYSETHEWLKAKIRLPQVFLDEVRMKPLSLDCRIRDMGSFSLGLSDSVVKEVCYNYDEATSSAFLSVALALRYKAPLVLEATAKVETISEGEVVRRFPMYSSVGTLQDTSQRVKENIERGVVVNNLQGALRIAMERGDNLAIARIREKLDEYDAMDDLPTLEERDGDELNQMQ